MIRCTTKSGSVYEIDGNKVRRVTRSPVSDSKRVTQEFKECQIIYPIEIGQNLVFFWGTGVDEHSPPELKDLGEANSRYTITTPVQTIERF